MRATRAMDYAEVLYGLLFPVGDYRPQDAAAPIAARVAERLGVSRASAGEMLRRMADQGLVERGPGRALRLTSAGIALAEEAVRTTRVLEVWLLRDLQLPVEEVHPKALELRDAFDRDMVDRLHAHLGTPDRCPHGWPIGAPDAPGELLRLAELDAGDRCEVVSVAESDGALVKWLFDAGVRPGAGLRVRDVQPAAGQLTVGVRRHGDVVLADRAAQAVYVAAA